MSGVDNLLSRLDRVRKTGRDRWTACCPAHADKGPSLSVREMDDGRTLVHCFAGCGVEEVLAALGMTIDGLFPERAISDRRPRERKPYSMRDLVVALRHELTICWTLLSALHAGLPITDADRARAGVAVDRVLHFLAEVDHVA